MNEIRKKVTGKLNHKNKTDNMLFVDFTFNLQVFITALEQPNAAETLILYNVALKKQEKDSEFCSQGLDTQQIYAVIY